MMASRVTKTNYIRAETNFLIVIRYFACLFFKQIHLYWLKVCITNATSKLAGRHHFICMACTMIAI